MKININNEEKDVKITFRGDFIYENVMGKSFEGKLVSEWVVYFWASYMGTNKDDENPMSLDDFMEWSDENRPSLTEFIELYTKTITDWKKLSPKKDNKKK